MHLQGIKIKKEVKTSYNLAFPLLVINPKEITEVRSPFLIKKIDCSVSFVVKDRIQISYLK